MQGSRIDEGFKTGELEVSEAQLIRFIKFLDLSVSKASLYNTESHLMLVKDLSGRIALTYDLYGSPYV